MSDFDKEAEREKLREQFERDREKRKESERMSELLLKGATMTNKHHDCGSPVFRWKGEEFCPSCEGPVGAGGEGTAERGAEPGTETEAGTESDREAGVDAADAEPAVDAAMDGEAADEVVASEPRATDAAEIDVTAEPAADEVGVGSESEAEATDREEPTTGRPGDRPSRAPPDPGTTDGAEPATGDADAAAAGGGVGGITAARASLERTLADVARQAEETPTSDLARKRNLVAATREAAEALEATRRAGRQ